MSCAAVSTLLHCTKAKTKSWSSREQVELNMIDLCMYGIIHVPYNTSM